MMQCQREAEPGWKQWSARRSDGHNPLPPAEWRRQRAGMHLILSAEWEAAGSFLFGGEHCENVFTKLPARNRESLGDRRAPSEYRGDLLARLARCRGFSRFVEHLPDRLEVSAVVGPERLLELVDLRFLRVAEGREA